MEFDRFSIGMVGEICPRFCPYSGFCIAFSKYHMKYVFDDMRRVPLPKSSSVCWKVVGGCYRNCMGGGALGASGQDKAHRKGVT